ncbi:hypothetical protein GGF31_008102 [Allomyces arbusculus]|nr:hypothetical protein GGF31_008102 [Allomyces arbusculus]
MYRPLIFYLALIGALLATTVMTPAARGAAVVAPSTDAIALAKTGSGGGKLGYAKDDGVMHVDRVRRAIGHDDIYAKRIFAKDDDDARKGKTGKGARQDDIKKGFATDEGEARMGHSKIGAEKTYSRSGKGDIKSDKGDFKTDKGANRGDLKEDLAKADGKLRVDRIRRAVRSDEIHAKKDFAKDGDVARVGGTKTGSLNAWSKAGE